MTIPGPIDPPHRLLMGPGPISAYPGVLRAMSAPLVGQYDPFMTASMAETQELYRGVWSTTNEATLLIDGTSRAGIGGLPALSAPLLTVDSALGPAPVGVCFVGPVERDLDLVRWARTVTGAA